MIDDQDECFFRYRLTRVDQIKAIKW